MDKIELKHLAPYLPYELRLTNCSRQMNGRMCELLSKHDYSTIKPILRPMSEFNNSNADEEIFNRFGYYISVTHDFFNLNETAYSVAEILFKNHFDVFGLIEKGLAIDINTLNLK